jgi:hypothetical protein
MGELRCSVTQSSYEAGWCSQSQSHITTDDQSVRRIAQLYPQAMGSSGTSGVPFPVPTIVGPWGDIYKGTYGT